MHSWRIQYSNSIAVTEQQYLKDKVRLEKKHMHTDAHKLNASYSGKENKKTANEMETLC